MEKSKSKKKWIIIGAVVAIVLIIGIVAGNSPSNNSNNTHTKATAASIAAETEEVSETTPETVPEITEPESQNYTLEHGELMSATVNDDIIIIKAKISSSYNNKATIDQNYYNVEDLITNQGCNSFGELQYWAVADMENGTEQKVVSFTIDADLIQSIADGSVPTNTLGDYVTDFWVHPSLEQ